VEEERGCGWFGCLVLIIVGALAYGLLHRLFLAPLASFLSDSLAGLREGLSAVASVLAPILNWGLTFALEEVLFWLVILLVGGGLATIVYVIRSLLWLMIHFVLGILNEFFRLFE